MKVNEVEPLVVLTSSCSTLKLLPLCLDTGFDKNHDDFAVWQWSQFLKDGGQKHTLSNSEAQRVKAYMREHETETLRADGETAYTLSNGDLIECDPSILAEIGDSNQDGKVNFMSPMSTGCSVDWARKYQHLLDPKGIEVRSEVALSSDLQYIRYITRNGAVIGKVRALDDQDEALENARLLGSSGRLLRSVEVLLSLVEKAAPQQVKSMEFQLATRLLMDLKPKAAQLHA